MHKTFRRQSHFSIMQLGGVSLEGGLAELHAGFQLNLLEQQLGHRAELWFSLTLEDAGEGHQECFDWGDTMRFPCTPLMHLTSRDGGVIRS